MRELTIDGSVRLQSVELLEIVRLTFEHLFKLSAYSFFADFVQEGSL